MPLAQVANLQPPYLIFLGDIKDGTFGKTGKGLVDWRPEMVVGQNRLPSCTVDLGVPDMSVAEAAATGAKSLVIGATVIGGALPDNWLAVLREAVAAGMDVVSGMHTRLLDIPELVSAASRSGSSLIDVRTPPANIPVATGRPRSGKRVLMVGTDCAVGKKYSALALTESLTNLGRAATFRATGQTGIILAGSGIAVDAVVADFLSGAAEMISPDNQADHWDVIEGQGSLFNPAYAGVSLGLMHGSQPDALILCHDAQRTRITGWSDYAIPGILECMRITQQMARLTNEKVRFAGLSINTSGLPSSKRTAYLEALAAETRLPCVDPVANGSREIADYLEEQF